MDDLTEQQFCRDQGYGCPCHSLPNPPWPSGNRPAMTCPSCSHPDLASADMPKWEEARRDPSNLLRRQAMTCPHPRETWTQLHHEGLLPEDPQYRCGRCGRTVPKDLEDDPVRAMYARLAAEYLEEPEVPDRRGGVTGDKYPMSA